MQSPEAAGQPPARMPDWKLLTPQRPDQLPRKEGRPLDVLPARFIDWFAAHSTAAMKNLLS
jgi:hypothetical protein